MYLGIHVLGNRTSHQPHLFNARDDRDRLDSVMLAGGSVLPRG